MKLRGGQNSLGNFREVIQLLLLLSGADIHRVMSLQWVTELIHCSFEITEGRVLWSHIGCLTLQVLLSRHYFHLKRDQCNEKKGPTANEHLLVYVQYVCSSIRTKRELSTVT